MTPSPLQALFRGRRTFVSHGFLVACVLVTGAGLLAPDLKPMLGGAVGRSSWWPALLSAFQHGWPGMPSIVHLGFNSFLVLECGRPCERLLGALRFALVSLAALAANVALQLKSQAVAGSSQVIWAWGPPLAMALWWTRRHGYDGGAARKRIGAVLLIMYVAVTLVMAGLPYLAGWRGHPLAGLWLGNRYHLVAMAVGVVAAVVWRRRIADRLEDLVSRFPPHSNNPIQQVDTIRW